MNKELQTSSLQQFGLRVHSHWHKYESRYPCAGYSKHEFARIPMEPFTL